MNGVIDGDGNGQFGANDPVTREQIAGDYTETTVRAQRELDENSRPALANTVDGMEDYDVIFLGYPKMKYGYNCVFCT